MDRLPIIVRAAVAISLTAFVGVGGFLWLLAPKLSEVKALRAQLVREQEAGRLSQPVPSVVPITEAERRLWAELEKRLRGRYPAEPDLPAAVVVVAKVARASGLELVSVGVEARGPVAAGPAPPALPPSPAQLPSEFGMNPSAIRVVAHHRYADLVKFLEELPRAPVYVTVQSLEVKRVENRLSTETSLATLRWGR